MFDLASAYAVLQMLLASTACVADYNPTPGVTGAGVSVDRWIAEDGTSLYSPPDCFITGTQDGTFRDPYDTAGR